MLLTQTAKKWITHGLQRTANETTAPKKSYNVTLINIYCKHYNSLQ